MRCPAAAPPIPVQQAAGVREVPRNAERRPAGNGATHHLTDQTAPSVALPRPRCRSLTVAGEGCLAYPARDGWPWCSSHRYLYAGSEGAS